MIHAARYATFLAFSELLVLFARSTWHMLGFICDDAFLDINSCIALDLLN